MYLKKYLKGQLSVFIIIVLILLILGIYFVSTSSESIDMEEINAGINTLGDSERNTIEQYVESAMIQVIKDAILDRRIVNESDIMSYIQEEGKMGDILDFSSFDDRFDSIEVEDYEYKISIIDDWDYIIFELECPITVYLGDSAMSLESFKVKTTVDNFECDEAHLRGYGGLCDWEVTGDLTVTKDFGKGPSRRIGLYQDLAANQASSVIWVFFKMDGEWYGFAADHMNRNSPQRFKCKIGVSSGKSLGILPVEVEENGWQPEMGEIIYLAVVGDPSEGAEEVGTEIKRWVWQEERKTCAEWGVEE